MRATMTKPEPAGDTQERFLFSSVPQGHASLPADEFLHRFMAEAAERPPAWLDTTTKEIAMAMPPRPLTENDGHALLLLGTALLQEGELEQARGTLQEAAAIFDNARNVQPLSWRRSSRAKAQVHLVLAELERRVPDLMASMEEIYCAFMDASVAQDEHTVTLTLEAMFGPEMKVA